MRLAAISINDDSCTNVLLTGNSIPCHDTKVVNLGTAIGYTILTETDISTVHQSQIAGSIGVSPAGPGAITGFNSLVLSIQGTFGKLASSLRLPKVHVLSHTPTTAHAKSSQDANWTSGAYSEQIQR